MFSVRLPKECTIASLTPTTMILDHDDLKVKKEVEV